MRIQTRRETTVGIIAKSCLRAFFYEKLGFSLLSLFCNNGSLFRRVLDRRRPASAQQLLSNDLEQYCGRPPLFGLQQLAGDFGIRKDLQTICWAGTDGETGDFGTAVTSPERKTAGNFLNKGRCEISNGRSSAEQSTRNL